MISLTGKVTRKILQADMMGAGASVTPSPDTVGVGITINGVEVMVSMPAADEVNYVMGSTITFNQA